MSDYDRNVAGRWNPSVARSQAAIDQGLRTYMLSVYNYMALGLAITGAAALGIYMLSVTTDPALAARVTGVTIERDERKGKQPSDHVPVVLDLAD